MAKRWKTPVYRLTTPYGKEVVIDVTTSVAPGLPPSSVLADPVIPFLKLRRVQRVLDFGAGALRHTISLLEAGFEVCSVEFAEAFQRPASGEALNLARTFSNFTSLVWPHDYLADVRRFDAALLCYVLQTMPLPDERGIVIKSLRKKLKDISYLVYMARANQFADNLNRGRKVVDGFYMWPQRRMHSFYREFSTEETHAMFDAQNFKYIRSLSQRGTDQMFLYAKGAGSWA
jgi:hypothetical protein